MVRLSSANSDRAGRERRRSLSLATAETLELLEARLFLSATVPTYQTANTTPVGGAPTAVVTDDFNQDGNEDIAVAQGGSNSVAILLGNGDGTFSAPTDFPTGADPTSIATGDFNNDGIDDIVTGDAGSGDISILLGRSDSNGNALGTFASPIDTHVEAAGGPLAVAVGDFNNDGNLDVAVGGPNGLYVLLGNGDGTFSAPQLVASGNFSGGVDADSFTQSGNTDLAALNPTTGMVEVFPGNGDGTFAAPTSYFVGVGASSISSGDFNNDGAEDIAVTVPGQNAVEVLLQNTTTVTVPLDAIGTVNPGGPNIPATGSLGSASGSGGGSNSYSYTTGSGTFASPITVQLDQTPSSLYLDDVNGDGNLDIVTANTADNSLTVIPGNGDGTFGTPLDIPVGNAPTGVAVDDFIGDGGQDLVSANAGNGSTDTGSASVVMEQASNVAVTLTSSSPYAVYGSDVTFTATLTNSGPGTATGVSLDEYLPSNFTLVSATSSAGTVDSSDPSDINATLADLPTGGSETVTVVAQATQYGPANNSVWISTDSIDANSNSYASVNTPVTGATGAEVALTSNSNFYFYPIVSPVSPIAASSPGSTTTTTTNTSTSDLLPIDYGWAQVGQDYTYTFTVTNYGPDPATGLSFTDTLPSGVTYVSSTASQGTTNSATPGTVTANLGDLASGASATVNITIVPKSVGNITDSATVVGTPDTNPYPAGASTTDSTYVSQAGAPIPLPVLYEGGATPEGGTSKTGAQPTLSVNSVRKTDVTKGKTDFVFTVKRTGNLDSASTVKYTTHSGTAKAGANFQSVSGELTFAAGASSATVTVPVKGSKKYSPNETFVLSLSGATNAKLKQSRAVGTILSAVAAPNPFAKGVSINFEPPGGPVVSGYLEDTGQIFAAQSNGFTYGWSTDNSANAVDDGKNPRFDTFNVLGTGGAANWKIDLPDGKYKLKITAGDASNTTNTYQVDANGSLVLSGKAKGKHPFVSSSATISIKDGLLTLTPGSDVSFDDLDFLTLRYLGPLK